MPTAFRSFEEFWPFYLREHARPATRAVHIGGTWTAAAVLAAGLLLGPWWLVLLAPVIGYGCAWISHLAIERNRPATFTYPPGRCAATCAWPGWRRSAGWGRSCGGTA